jgi:glutaminyl-tRNA synthetase
MTETTDSAGTDFIRQIIAADISSGKHDGRVTTRFPPEPNGFLHIGHVKSICLNFGVAAENHGQCFLRFDDTNPLKEDQDFVDAIIDNVHWLGFDWEDRLTHASDYFPDFFDCAVQLIKDGNAYVDSLSAEETRAYRGTLTEPGRNSPDRDRSVEENLDLFHRMRAGEFADGTYVLRPAMTGAFTRCMTSRIRSPMRSKALRIRCARWSLRTIGLYMSGFSIIWRCPQDLGRSSFRD